MTINLGDDLTAARRFSDECLDTLSSLISGGERSGDAIINALEDIQSQATDLKARSIRIAARVAIEDLAHSHSPANRSGSLLALNKLVHQYTQGLNQIAPSAQLHPVLSAQILQDDARNMQTARETLAPLKHLAKPGAETAAITALLNLSPIDLQSASPKPADLFDVIMPAVTGESLRKARHSKKSVSVSYATDEIFMGSRLSKTLETALAALCKGLVERCVEVPLRRQNQGLSGTAHIAITARRNAGTFDVIVTSEGPIPNASLIHHPDISALESFGAASVLTGHETLTRIDITGLPLSVAAAPTKSRAKHALRELKA